MSNRFVAIDLSGMAPPDVVERLEYEAVLAEMKADAVARLASVGIDYNVGSLETDPIVVVLETAAYRETLLRARVNDATRAIMLAYAQGHDLEHRGVYYGVERMVIPATADTPEVREKEDALRRRIQLAPEALAAAGPEGAYAFHTLSVDPSIVDVAVLNPAPGHIHVLPLVAGGDGVPGQELLERVLNRLRQPKIKPLTDILTVRAPTVVPYSIAATLAIASGPDKSVVVALAKSKAADYATERRRVGMPVNRSGIFAALHVPGVERVDLASPTADVVPAEDQVAVAGEISVVAA